MTLPDGITRSLEPSELRARAVPRRGFGARSADRERSQYKNEARTSTGQAVEGSHRAHLRSLRSQLSNLTPRIQTLASSWTRGACQVWQRPTKPSVSDVRGSLVRRIETVHTFLTAEEVDNLTGDYLAVASIKELASQYGIHRATVFAHLRRKNVPRRPVGPSVDEASEIVRLFRGGTSMRAFSRSLGVGRQRVRTCLDEAGAAADARHEAVSTSVRQCQHAEECCDAATDPMIEYRRFILHCRPD